MAAPWKRERIVVYGGTLARTHSLLTLSLVLLAPSCRQQTPPTVPRGDHSAHLYESPCQDYTELSQAASARRQQHARQY